MLHVLLFCVSCVVCYISLCVCVSFVASPFVYFRLVCGDTMSDLSTYIYIPNRIYIMYRYIYTYRYIYMCAIDILADSLDI